MDVRDVIIVGAGLKGLQAAKNIQAAGFTCHVVEAEDQIGSKTINDAPETSNSPRDDANSVWANQPDLYALAQHYGFDLKSQKAINTETSDDSTTTYPSDRRVLSEEESKVVSEALSLTRELLKNTNLEDPENSEDAYVLDTFTVKDYYQKHISSPIGVKFAKKLTLALLGIGADEVSMLYFLSYCKSCYGLDVLLSEQKEDKQSLGSTQDVQKSPAEIASKLSPNTILLSQPVSSIEYPKPNAKNGTCKVHTRTGLTLHAKHVVITIPPTLYSTIDFHSPLPTSKRNATSNAVKGYYSKMTFMFSTPWWRHSGLSGVLHCDTGPLVFTRDTSITIESESGSLENQYSISCFITGERGRQWSKLPKSTRRKAIWDQFAAAFSNVTDDGQVPAPIAIFEFEWSKLQYFGVGGAAPSLPVSSSRSSSRSRSASPPSRGSLMRTGTGFSSGGVGINNRYGATVMNNNKALRLPVGCKNVHFAGEHKGMGGSTNGGTGGAAGRRIVDGLISTLRSS